MLDVVILSNAKTKELFSMTFNAIESLLESAHPGVQVFVVEQNTAEVWESYFKKCVKTIYIDEPFNYNRFANIAAFQGKSEYICISNNDVKFSYTWLWELIKAGHPVMSPRCPVDKRQADIVKNECGTQVGRDLSGWCFVIRRDIWEKIGGFDEDFSFWCADNSLMEQLIAIGIEPMIVANSIVEHLGSRTLKTVDNRDELTVQQVKKYNKKYNRNLFGWGI